MNVMSLLFLFIGVLLGDSIQVRFFGHYAVSCTLVMYCLVLWLPCHWLIKVLFGGAVLVLAPLYGHSSLIELFFVITVALNAYVLKSVLHNSWPVKLIFTLLSL